MHRAGTGRKFVLGCLRTLLFSFPFVGSTHVPNMTVQTLIYLSILLITSQVVSSFQSKGEQCERCCRGDPGPSGIHGQHGLPGATGAEGRKGDRGEKGYKGDKGENELISLLA